MEDLESDEDESEEDEGEKHVQIPATAGGTTRRRMRDPTPAAPRFNMDDMKDSDEEEADDDDIGGAEYVDIRVVASTVAKTDMLLQLLAEGGSSLSISSPRGSRKAVFGRVEFRDITMDAILVKMAEAPLKSGKSGSSSRSMSFGVNEIKQLRKSMSGQVRILPVASADDSDRRGRGRGREARDEEEEEDTPDIKAMGGDDRKGRSKSRDVRMEVEEEDTPDNKVEDDDRRGRGRGRDIRVDEEELDNPDNKSATAVDSDRRGRSKGRELRQDVEEEDIPDNKTAAVIDADRRGRSKGRELQEDVEEDDIPDNKSAAAVDTDRRGRSKGRELRDNAEELDNPDSRAMSKKEVFPWDHVEQHPSSSSGRAMSRKVGLGGGGDASYSKLKPVKVGFGGAADPSASSNSKPQKVGFGGAADPSAPAESKPRRVGFGGAADPNAPSDSKPRRVGFGGAADPVASSETKPRRVGFGGAADPSPPSEPKPGKVGFGVDSASASSHPKPRRVGFGGDPGSNDPEPAGDSKRQVGFGVVVNVVPAAATPAAPRVGFGDVAEAAKPDAPPKRKPRSKSVAFGRKEVRELRRDSRGKIKMMPDVSYEQIDSDQATPDKTGSTGEEAAKPPPGSEESAEKRAVGFNMNDNELIMLASKGAQGQHVLETIEANRNVESAATPTISTDAEKEPAPGFEGVEATTDDVKLARDDARRVDFECVEKPSQTVRGRKLRDPTPAPLGRVVLESDDEEVTDAKESKGISKRSMSEAASEVTAYDSANELSDEEDANVNEEAAPEVAHVG